MKEEHPLDLITVIDLEEIYNAGSDENEKEGGGEEDEVRWVKDESDEEDDNFVFLTAEQGK